MPFCDNCGVEHTASAHFCISCGAALIDESGYPEASSETLILLGYPISLKRILFMVVISYGLYIFYWYYLTWKQYRDHTNEVVYPVWHALTLLVPIYGLFRTHAHTRIFRESMVNADLPSSINPKLAVIVVLATGVLDHIALRIAGGAQFGGIRLELGVAGLLSLASSAFRIIKPSGLIDLTQGELLSSNALYFVAIALTAGLLLHVQNNINEYWTVTISKNEYWSSSAYPQKIPFKVGLGEIIFGIIGALAWLDTLANLFSESWRMRL